MSLTWTASGEADLDAYSVYRSTSAGSGHALIADDLGTTGYDDRDVTPGTTYFYVVTATDLSGNESDPSNEAAATPSEPVQATVHVERIDPALVTRGVNVVATMSVTVSDADGIPVPGARVDGSWTLNGVGLGTAGGDTDGTGTAFVESPKVKAESGDILTFAVTNVVAGGATYRPDQNLETSDSIAVP